MKIKLIPEVGKTRSVSANSIFQLEHVEIADQNCCRDHKIYKDSLNWIPELVAQVVFVVYGSKYSQESVSGEENQSVLSAKSGDVAEPLTKAAHHRTMQPNAHKSPVCKPKKQFLTL